MPSNRPTFHLALMVALPVTFFQQGVDAAEWVAEPSVMLREEYNDNYRLTSTDPDKVWKTSLDPRLKLSRRTEVWDVNATGRIRADYFSGEDGLDTVDNFLDIGAKRTLQRGSFGAALRQANDTTLQNEILDIDTGITVQQIDRTQRSASVTGQYMLLETTAIEGSVGFSTVDYDEGEQFGLLDYDYFTPTLRVIRHLDQKTQVFGVLSHSRVRYDNASDLESKTDSLQLGATYEITETWKVNGSVGSRRTRSSETLPIAVERPGFEILYPDVYDIEFVPRDSESSGLVYNASIDRKFETGRVTVSAMSAVTPSAIGTDTESTQIDLRGIRDFTAQLSAALAVNYYRSEAVGGAVSRANTDRFRVSPSVNWRLDRDLILSAGYVFTRVERGTTSTGDADSNAVYVSLGYAWPRIAVSR